MTKRRGPQLPKSAPAPASSADIAGQVQRLVREGAQLLAEKRPGEAATLLARAIELDPDNAAAAINLGGAYILQGRHKLAIPVLETAARLEPDNPMVWTNLAAAHLGKLLLATREQQDRAIAAYERALALEPRTPHAYYNLGLIYLERRDPERAATCFHQALLTDPGDRDAQLWLNKIARDEIGPEEGRG